MFLKWFKFVFETNWDRVTFTPWLHGYFLFQHLGNHGMLQFLKWNISIILCHVAF